MKLGMTGSREGISKQALKELNNFLKKNQNDITECHHGDCVGADTIFHDRVVYIKEKAFNEAESKQQAKMKLIVHPPNINTLRSHCKGDEVRVPKSYLERNRDIVDASDTMIAFPSTRHEVQRSGTWYTIKYAKKQNKNIHIIYSDGSINSVMKD